MTVSDAEKSANTAIRTCEDMELEVRVVCGLCGLCDRDCVVRACSLIRLLLSQGRAQGFLSFGMRACCAKAIPAVSAYFSLPEGVRDFDSSVTL